MSKKQKPIGVFKLKSLKGVDPKHRPMLIMWLRDSFTDAMCILSGEDRNANSKYFIE
jgi:hypothetical protein